jgi:hypothetical protein
MNEEKYINNAPCKFLHEIGFFDLDNFIFIKKTLSTLSTQGEENADSVAKW